MLVVIVVYDRFAEAYECAIFTAEEEFCLEAVVGVDFIGKFSFVEVDGVIIFEDVKDLFLNKVVICLQVMFSDERLIGREHFLYDAEVEVMRFGGYFIARITVGTHG